MDERKAALKPKTKAFLLTSFSISAFQRFLQSRFVTKLATSQRSGLREDGPLEFCNPVLALRQSQFIRPAFEAGHVKLAEGTAGGRLARLVIVPSREISRAIHAVFYARPRTSPVQPKIWGPDF